MEEEILLYVMTVIVILMLICFAYNYTNLKKFKECYDINFQEKCCEKYLNY